MAYPTPLQSKPDPEQFCHDGGVECPCCSFTTEEKFSFTLHLLENHISHAVDHGGMYASTWPWTGHLTLARLSESTITKQPASTETVMVQDDSDEKIEEELKRKFIRDIGVAWCWVQSHCELFHGEVTEPEFLQMDEEKQSNIIKDYLKRETEKARDACVFVFDNREDMETFLLKCVDEQGLKVNKMFLGVI